MTAVAVDHEPVSDSSLQVIRTAALHSVPRVLTPSKCTALDSPVSGPTFCRTTSSRAPTVISNEVCGTKHVVYDVNLMPPRALEREWAVVSAPTVKVRMTGHPMENPYWKSEIKPHYLDRESARIKCFDAFNILSASVALAGDFEMMEPATDTEPSSMFKLHHRLAEQRLSQLLLDIAVFVRTFDDYMTSAAPEAYRRFSAKNDGANFIGALNGDEKFNLREACNKIIHAGDFRPVYDYVDRELNSGKAQRVWHLDGQIELRGTQGEKPWEATLYIEHFLEVVLDRLEFESSEGIADKEGA